MTESPNFNLVDRPWIAARYLDSSNREVSIRTVFRDAASIRELGGELPTQVFAITRLLLAILYRATYDEDTPTGWHEDDWARWWRDGLPLDDVDDYLDEFRDRFDLFDADRPFFQVAGLRTARDEVKDTAPLILDLPSNNRLFTNRSGPDALRLSFAEAARWLVNAHAFDPSGIKSGAVGDDRVKGGRGYPIGIAWSGHLGGLLAEGTTLAETLLLNLVLPGKTIEIDPTSDLPPWEDPEPDGPAVRAGLHPSGPVRLATWQSRRIRLVAEDDQVVGVVLTNGDPLTPQNQHDHEPLTAWRYSEPQTKKHGRTTYMPREHRAGRAFWRGIAALLPRAVVDAARGPQLTQSPGVVRHLAEQTDLEVIPASVPLRLRAIGVIYGSNNSVVDDVIDDRIDLTFALLAQRNAELAAEAESAVELADQGVQALRRLASNLDRAAGGDGEAARERAGASAYAELDGEYRAWLATLKDGVSPADAIARWKVTASRLLHALGDALLADAGPAAWAGREVHGLGGTELITASRADGWFRSSLYKTFGSPQAAETGEESTT